MQPVLGLSRGLLLALELSVIAGAVLGFGIARLCFSQRGRFRSVLVEDLKRETRETADSAEDPMLADGTDIRQVV